MLAANTIASAQIAFDTQAHRGGRGLMPENTIPAMKNALRLGVTTLEMDTHITKDKQVLLSHDPYLSYKYVSLPDGTAMTKKDKNKYAIYAMNYDEIRRFDVGSKYYQAFPQQQKMRAYIPLLSELIDSVESFVAEQQLPLPQYNIETKLDDGGDGILHPHPEEFVRLLMDVIIAKNIEERVIIQSFDPRTLEIVHRDYPSIRTAWLVENLKSCKANMQALTFTPTIYSPFYKKVNPKVVKYCHERGIKVIPWTVNSVKQMDKMKAFNVDGIISDYPDLF